MPVGGFLVYGEEWELRFFIVGYLARFTRGIAGWLLRSEPNKLRQYWQSRLAPLPEEVIRRIEEVVLESLELSSREAVRRRDADHELGNDRALHQIAVAIQEHLEILFHRFPPLELIPLEEILEDIVL